MSPVLSIVIISKVVISEAITSIVTLSLIQNMLLSLRAHYQNKLVPLTMLVFSTLVRSQDRKVALDFHLVDWLKQ